MPASEFPADSSVPHSSDLGQPPDSNWAEASPTPEQPVPLPRPWGPWATIGWTIVCLLAMAVIQIIVLVIFVVFRLAQAPGSTLKLDELAHDGNLFGLAGSTSLLGAVGLVILLVSVRRSPIRDYLALSWPPARRVIMAIVGQLILLTAYDLSSYWFDRPITSPVMLDIYRTAWLPLLMVTILVAAPVGEEILFRGFLYKGIAASRAGPIAAILLSSVVWASLHLQYDWIEILRIALLGIYLGSVRYQTESVSLTILLHFLTNAVATLEMVIQDQGLI
jgi:membrane protease YdiL (CAAX protease family)